MSLRNHPSQGLGQARRPAPGINVPQDDDVKPGQLAPAARKAAQVHAPVGLAAVYSQFR